MATELIVDDAGVVVGVTATNDGTELFVEAAKGVVLGTGGFDHNNAMLRSFQPMRPLISNAALGNTGDGQTMGVKIGAALEANRSRPLIIY